MRRVGKSPLWPDQQECPDGVVAAVREREPFLGRLETHAGPLDIQLGHLLHSKSAELPKTAGLEEVVVLEVGGEE